MASLTADFELGTNGNAIAVADAGSASAWDVVSQTNGTATYDTTRSAHGTTSAKIANGGSGGYARALEWTSSLTATTTYFFRFYMYWTANPGATGTCAPVGARLAAADCWRLVVSSAGAITITNQGGSTIATFTTTLPLNAWTRVEGSLAHGTGSIEIKLFSGDSTSPLETKTLTSQSLRASIDEWYLGLGSLSTTMWVDDVVANAAAYPGPVVTASPAIPQQDTASVLAAMGFFSS